MLRLLKNKKAQSTMEYAILIAVVIGAFTTMQLYVRRGMNARIKDGSDNIPGKVFTQAGVTDILETEQYEPYYSRKGSLTATTTSDSGTEKGTVTDSGGKEETLGETYKRSVTAQTMAAEAQDDWMIK